MPKAPKRTTPSPAENGSTGARKSLAEFRKQHDKSFIVPQKVRAALKALGARGWAYELEFLRLAGLSTTDLAAYRDVFEDHWLVVDRTKRVWAGSPAFKTELARMAQS